MLLFLEVLDWIVENFGGAYYGKKVYGKNHNKSYNWTIGTKKAGDVIKMVYPYLIIKRKQAKVIIAYREIQQLRIRTCPGRRIVPQELREEIFCSLKMLNHRGAESVEANTFDVNNLLTKIESELVRNSKNRISDDLVVRRN